MAVAALLAIVVAACSSGTKSTSSAPAPKDEGPPRNGGRVVYGLEAETSGGYCLSTAQLAISGIMVASAIYEPLTMANDKGEFVGFLAESLTPSPDYKTWTIKLRPNIKFQNGEPFDAGAVKLNLDEVRKGPLGTFSLANISDVTVSDPMTVVVTTKVPWPALPAYLNGGGRYGMMAPAQINDKANCPRNLIGTGPFKLKEYQINDKLVVARNPNYWRPGLPHLDEIEFRPAPDVSSRLNGLRAGQLDVIHTTSALDIKNLRTDVKAGRFGMVESDLSAEVGYVMLNSSKPPFDDIRARQAVAYAIDREALLRILAGGLQKVANGPFAPDVPGYLPDPGFPKFDQAKAKQLVAAYQTEKGPLQFTLHSTPQPEIIRVAELIKEQLGKVGIQIDLKQLEQASLINTALGGTFQATLWRNHAGNVPDGQYVWWYSSSPVNFGKFKDPQIDSLLDQGRVELDPAKRQAIYENVNRRFAEQVWNVWLSYQLWAIVTGPKVRGVLGPDLPNGDKPRGMVAGFHQVAGLWRSG